MFSKDFKHGWTGWHKEMELPFQAELMKKAKSFDDWLGMSKLLCDAQLRISTLVASLLPSDGDSKKIPRSFIRIQFNSGKYDYIKSDFLESYLSRGVIKKFSMADDFWHPAHRIQKSDRY